MVVGVVDDCNLSFFFPKKKAIVDFFVVVVVDVVVVLVVVDVVVVVAVVGNFKSLVFAVVDGVVLEEDVEVGISRVVARSSVRLPS